MDPILRTESVLLELRNRRSYNIEIINEDSMASGSCRENDERGKDMKCNFAGEIRIHRQLIRAKIAIGLWVRQRRGCFTSC